MKELKDKEYQYNELLNYKEQSKRNSGFKKILGIISLVIVVLICLLVIFIKNTDLKDSKLFSDLELSKCLKKESKESEDFIIKKQNFNIFNRRQNILLLGVDSNGSDTDAFSNTRSDTIIVLNIDPHSKTVNAISIPRDSKVYVARNHGIQKINSAHALGGIKLAKSTIEDTLGIKIDRYVIVNTEGIKKLVNSIGGVPVYIEKDMYYNDYAGKLHINLHKGLNLLNGDAAVGYIRYRKDALGDIGRTSRQQWFLRSLLKKLQTPEVIPKIPELLNIASTYVKTDLTLYEMSHIIALLRNIDMSEIEVATLPGGPSRKGYISYWILDPEKTQEVIDRLIYRIKPKIADKKLIAGIMYSWEKEEEAMLIKSKLLDLGYEVNCIGRAKLPHSQIIAHNTYVSSELINWLKKKVPEVKSSQFVYDPIKMYCVNSDFTIIIADS